MRYSILGAALAASVASAQSSSAMSGSASASMSMSMSGSMSASASASSASASGSSSGNGSYIATVAAALTQYNLTTLAQVAEMVYMANTTMGMQLFNNLQSGNLTVFAPSNMAFANSNMSSMMNDTTYMTEVLAYHILNATWTTNNTMVMPNHTIARTMLNGGNFTLPGNYSAPVVLTLMSANSTNITVVEAFDNVTTMASATVGNLMLYIIDEVLTLPMSIGEIAMKLFPSLAGVIEKFAPGVIDSLEMSNGITVFAPDNAAISAMTSALGTLNMTQIETLLMNHVINGSVVYSDDLMMSNWTSAAGEPFMFMSNSSGMYVMMGNSTAMITQSDIILENGVAYVIDNVLVNTMSNSTAAAAAYSSGIAAASSTDNASPATSSASASGSSKAAAGVVAPVAWNNALIGGVLAFAGVILGGGYILA